MESQSLAFQEVKNYFSDAAKHTAYGLLGIGAPAGIIVARKIVKMTFSSFKLTSEIYINNVEAAIPEPKAIFEVLKIVLPYPFTVAMT